MSLKLVKSLWGVLEAGDTAKWDALFARIKAEGFEAVEAITLTWRMDSQLFLSLLRKHGLSLVCQIHTTGGSINEETGEYEYCTSNKLNDHVVSFVALATEAAALKPVLINSHSGHDSWGSGDKAVDFLEKALETEAILGIPIVHETHRQRLFFSPYSAAELLANKKLEKLKINADLSHWCCVCEHLFDHTDPRDDFWLGTLQTVAAHCGFVHCRVGHAEGPQVPEPDAPEWVKEVDTHFEWWRFIWSAMCKRGDSVIWSEPEFGPPPYLQTLPYTQVPVADLCAVNTRVADRMRKEFEVAAAIVGT